MTVGVATCPADIPVTDLARRFLDEGLEEIVVLEDGNALGVVRREDLLKAYLQDDPAPMTAQDVLREGVPQVPPDIPLKAAAQIMLDQRIGALYLMHHAGGIEYPAAVLGFWHLLRHLSADDQDDLSDLGINARRQSPVQAFFQRRDAARKVNLSKKVK